MLEGVNPAYTPPELDANTLSVLFMERLARMPEVGDEIQEDEHRLKVLDLKDRRVGRVVIKRCTPVEATSGSNKAKSSEAGTSADTLEGIE